MEIDGFTKFVIGIVSTIIVLGGSYFVFKTDHIFEVVLPKNETGESVKKFVTGVRDAIYAQVGPYIEPYVKKGKEAAEGVVLKVKIGTDDLLNKARQDTVDSIKKSVNERIDSIAGLPVTLQSVSPADEAGAASGSGSGSVSGGLLGSTVKAPQVINDNFPLSFSVKKGLPAIFIVKENNNLAMTYTILWGDGKKDVGEVSPGGAKTVYHVWEQEGEYGMKIETKIGESLRNYSSSILIY